MTEPAATTNMPKADAKPAKAPGETAAKVFTTTELLEQILLNLSTRQLFGVQRTCKTFLNTIQDSVQLQRAMFLQQDPDVASVRATGALNPLLYEMVFTPAGRQRGNSMGTLRLDDHSESDNGGVILHLKRGGRRESRAAVRDSEQSWTRTILAHGSEGAVIAWLPCPTIGMIDVEEIELGFANDETLEEMFDMLEMLYNDKVDSAKREMMMELNEMRDEMGDELDENDEIEMMEGYW